MYPHIFKHVNGGFRKTDNLEDPNLDADSVISFCDLLYGRVCCVVPGTLMAT